MPKKQYVRTIELGHHVPSFPRVSFLRAEIPVRHFSSLVRIKYALDGQEKKDGLRLDINKQVFLDNIPGHPEMSPILQEVAPEIAQYLGSVLFKAESKNLPSQARLPKE